MIVEFIRKIEYLLSAGSLIEEQKLNTEISEPQPLRENASDFQVVCSTSGPGSQVTVYGIASKTKSEFQGPTISNDSKKIVAKKRL